MLSLMTYFDKLPHPGRVKLFGRAVLFLAVGVLAAHVPAGCSTGEVKEAGDAKPTFECTSEPVIFCNPVATGAPGCTGTADSADAFLKRLPADKSFAEGCVANFVRRDPLVEEVCGLAAVCTCVRVEDAVDAAPPPVDSAVADSAIPDSTVSDAGDPDASSDAETDASVVDASPVPPLPDATAPDPDAAIPPAKPARLVWNCR